MPLSFEEFQGKGVLDFSSSSSSSCSDSSLLPLQHQQEQPHKWGSKGCEPTSVLDLGKSPSPPTSSSTLSSSHGGSSGGGSGASTGTATGVSGNHPVDIGTEKCGMGMDDWESVLSGSPSQEQSILRLIMGDVEDPSMGLSKILQQCPGSQEMEFNAGFGMVDQGMTFESFGTGGNLVSNIDTSIAGTCSDFARMGSVSNPTNPIFASSTGHLLSASVPLGVGGGGGGGGGAFQQQQQQPLEPLDEKPQIFNPQMIINQNQAQFTQNPAMFLPLSYAQLQEHQLLSPPPPKRFNSASGGPNYQVPKVPFTGFGQEPYLRRQQQQQQQLQMLQQRPTTMGMPTGKPKMVSDELANQQLQQAIIEQVSKAAELIETGNPVLAQGILARLNHQLSPFANFTCNQALLEAFEGFDRIRIIDFDIGYGGQWASLMQELVMRSSGAPSLKITAFASPSTQEEIELSFTLENLKHFASEINMSFEIEIVRLESLNSTSLHLPPQVLESEAIAVNLPISSFSNCPSTLPLVVRFVKQLSPKIVVSLDRGCDRTDVPFAQHMIHALQSYSGLIESLDAMNMNTDALQKIERFLLQPSIEKIVLGRHRSLERTPTGRGLFMQSGFSPLTFSNFTESQAECLVQRTPVRGFHIEKRQSSLVLFWQRRELIAASAWRC
ncbi:hypothetical protein SLA2020_473460 [Shorea laevis]